MRSRSAWVALMILLASIAMPLAGAAPREITVAVRNLTPFVMMQDGTRSGFTIEVWEEIARRQQWSTKYVEVDTVAAQLKSIEDGSAEVAAGAISITAERLRTHDFSQPILAAGLQILVPKRAAAATEPSISDFLPLLLSKTMLLWILGGLLLALVPAHVLWLAERRHPESTVSKSYFPGVFEAFLYSGETLTATQEDRPSHWFARAWTILWGFVAIVFASFFTATLTTTLTVNSFEAQINRPQDLFGKKVATVAGTTSEKYLAATGVNATALRDIGDCYNALRNDGYKAVVFDAPVLDYYVTHDGADLAELAGPVFQPEDYGLAFAKGGPLRQAVDEALLAMRQDGTYDQIRAKYFGNPADG